MMLAAGARDHIGGVETAAQADFEQQIIGRGPAEEQEGGRGGDLEHGDRLPRIDTLAFVERRLEPRVVDEFAGEANALIEAHEMWRGVDMHALPRRFQDRPHECDGRALAVGSCDMDDARQAQMRRAEVGEQALDAAQRQVDPSRMERRESR